MRFLIDENVPGPVVAMLREHGHDVAAVKESLAGASDLTILERAHAEDRLVVTCDKDFGELAVRFRLPVHEFLGGETTPAVQVIAPGPSWQLFIGAGGLAPC